MKKYGMERNKKRGKKKYGMERNKKERKEKNPVAGNWVLGLLT